MNSKTKERTPAANTSRAWKGNSAGARIKLAASKTGFPTALTSLTGKRRMGGEKMRRRTDSDEVTMLVVSSRMPRMMAAMAGKRIAVTNVMKRVSVAGKTEKRLARAEKRNMVAVVWMPSGLWVVVRAVQEWWRTLWRTGSIRGTAGLGARVKMR